MTYSFRNSLQIQKLTIIIRKRRWWAVPLKIKPSSISPSSNPQLSVACSTSQPWKINSPSSSFLTTPYRLSPRTTTGLSLRKNRLCRRKQGVSLLSSRSRASNTGGITQKFKLSKVHLLSCIPSNNSSSLRGTVPLARCGSGRSWRNLRGIPSVITSNSTPVARLLCMTLLVKRDGLLTVMEGPTLLLSRVFVKVTSSTPNLAISERQHIRGRWKTKRRESGLWSIRVRRERESLAFSRRSTWTTDTSTTESKWSSRISRPRLRKSSKAANFAISNTPASSSSSRPPRPPAPTDKSEH